MKTPHKHAEVIKAWADGATIQVRDPSDAEDTWEDTDQSQWFEDWEYRIKPEPKPDVVRYLAAKNTYGYSPDKYKARYVADGQFIKATFCGETGKLKSAEVV